MLTVGFSTRKDNPDFISKIKITCGVDVEICQVINNGEKSLSQVYNEILEKAKTDIIVFCHDDIVFESKKWGKKILENFQKSDYGILGLAGSTYMPSSGRWWEMPITMRGIVNHQHNGKKWESKYSVNEGKISPTLLIDGLFIAIDKNKIVKKFDETFEGFHFYDVSFSFSNFLQGVKIGVTYDVRVTHLSIGQTNQQWEDNRVFFSNTFEKELPCKLDLKFKDLTTYIICHDQEIILLNIDSEKFQSLGNVVFLFVGFNNHEKIQGLPNVIIVNKLKHNIERYPKFTAFTAWYAIWRNELCKTKYINLLEYDVNLKEDFSFFLKNYFTKSPKIINYFPVSMRNYHFIDNPNWTSTLFEAIKSHYKIDIENFIRSIISENLKQNREPVWGTTNNVCFEYSFFKKYLTWFSPLVNYLKEDVNCGHAQERAVTFYSLINKISPHFFQGQIEHLQMDSHKTQGHSVDYQKNIKSLTNGPLNSLKNKNAIVTLSRGYNEISKYNSLIRRNIEIYNNIISKNIGDFDLIIYHEGNITLDHQNYISSITPNLDLTFLDVKKVGSKKAFNDTKNKLNLELCPPTPQSNAFPLGYKHMCHFWAIDFIDYLMDYDYVIRIDEDCFVKSFDDNVLEKMKSDNIHFVSPYFQEQDEDSVIVGLEKLWEEFISENKITPYKSFNQIRCPYTNFIIFDVKYISQNESIKKILEKIDSSHGIYSNRWGDLPIWGMILSTLIDENYYLENKNISYLHGSHNKLINH